MRKACLFAVAGLAWLMSSSGCSDDTKAVTADQSRGGKDAAIVDAVKSDAPKVDTAAPSSDLSPDKRLTDYNLTLCNDAAALLADTLANGIKVFKGLTSTTASVPIADVLSNIASYTGKVVRIEGVITEVCPAAGCYVKLLDKSGQIMALKVDDGTYDFRLTAKAGNYAVGEGLPTLEGDHGPQVYIQNYGAMIGTALCPVP